MKKSLFIFLFSISLLSLADAQQPAHKKLRRLPGPLHISVPLPGADQTGLYVNYLKGKNVGMVINQTSVIGPNHTPSLDTLLKLGVHIVKIFGPEHGFRGTASNGAVVNDTVDPKTGIPAISLYGKHYKPTAEDLKGLDLVIFDIQDVGTRFYT
ncbi:MAG: DUF1343 domain-containing protein, partial [Bacteroidetes bacterium]|nr:DUF1343 domain-containing protein [Bacteroidota bacterium]